MAFEADIKRYHDKNENVRLFKAALLTFEEVRATLQKRYRYDIYYCSDCGYANMIGSDVHDYPIVEVGQGIIDNKLGSLAHYIPLSFEQYRVCPNCGKEDGLNPVVCSAIECNPTVINDGLNDVFKLPTGRSDTVGVLCYKFGLHFDGNRAEPVYLVLAAKKNRWNYDVESVSVVRFPSKGSTTSVSWYRYDAVLDYTVNRLKCVNDLCARVESELLATIK